MKPIFCFVFVFFHLIAHAQQDTSQLRLFSYGLTAHKGFIFAHSEAVQNTKGSYPFGLQVDLNWQLTDEKTWNTCYCYPRTGFFLQYFNFDNAILGHGFTAATFIEPYFSYSNRVNMAIKAAAGLSYLTNPYHAQNNPANMSYSLSVSGFVSLGIGANIRLTPRLNISTYIHYNHISNGGIKDPNKGINWPTASAGFDYALHPVVYPARKKTRYMDYKGKAPRVDMYAFWSSKTVQAGEKERWMIWGGGLNLSKQTGVFNALTLGGEWNIDMSLAEKLKRNGNSHTSNHRAGLLFGHEFLMGKIIFSQQLGLYLFNPSSYFDPVYQRYGLLYRFNNHIGAGINILAHRQVANFMDFRFTYSF